MDNCRKCKHFMDDNGVFFCRWDDEYLDNTDGCKDGKEEQFDNNDKENEK